MVALILLLVSSLSLGTLLLRYVERVPGTSSLPGKGVVLLVAGMGVWCCTLFIAGMAGMVARFHLVFYVILSCVPGGTFLVRNRRVLRLPVYKPHLTPVEWTLCGVNALFLLLLALCAFSPVTGGIANDEIHTHLSTPAFWLQHGAIAPQEHPVSYMAGNGELLFLLTSAFSRGSGPRLVSWCAFALVVLLVYMIARRFLPRTQSLIAATMVTINPLLFRMSCIAFVDTLSMMFMLASLLAYLGWRGGAPRKVLFLSMAFGGIGCGVKPTIVVYAGVLFLFTIYDVYRTRSQDRNITTLLVAGAVLFLTAAPWPTKLLLQTGSPTFPPPPVWQKLQLPQKFCRTKIPYTEKQVASFYTYVNSRYGTYRTSVKGLIALPWQVTMHPEPFQAGDGIGTLLLSLMPIALVIACKRRRGDALLLSMYAACAVTVIYFAILPEARYFSVAYAAAAPLLALPFSLNKKYRLVSYGCSVVLVANTLLAAGVFMRTMMPLVHAAIDPVCREELRKEKIPYYEAFGYIEGLPGRNKVKVFYDTPLWYYLEKGYQVVSGISADSGSVYLDIDYSEVDGRRQTGGSGTFYVAQPSKFGLKLLFDGGDARVYAGNYTQKK